MTGHKRLMRRRVATPSSSREESAVKQKSSDIFLDVPSRIAEERLTCATKVFNMSLDRTSDMPKWLSTMRTLIDAKEARMTAEQAQKDAKET